ncbi:FAD-dependent oxidoreductase [Rhodanobacter sp. A1T4]|jgi:glycine/D-amino acid oxidase-like deaminating enzyme|uniref:FAD-dependent oxidoreductase n=1 Tax=Rhodanobacter sp. A1T4 TaxID=2723087 RepID=UPI001619CC9A|nr:FAD-dependent oxidoreductase [Rhodanobacter sp. A1T4]MBB6245043.1 glycine/D-amino acid oxidase-like deaminating enzyme [Rhodanobacter sp. A1T4]
MQRRQFLRNAGATLAVASTAGLVACARQPLAPTSKAGTLVSPPIAGTPGMVELAPIRAQTDRITGVYVCTRPFRAAGPRIETQRLGEKTIVHNYGHGGSGWSLSWGSSMLALRMAQDTGVHKLGVIGCGALGLTSALLAQRAGMSVCIYAKALPPDVYSMRASGLWTPDSRICDAQHAPDFGARWETMARTSYGMYQTLLGLPGRPIEWIDGYSLSDTPFNQPQPPEVSDEPDYGEFRDRVRDLTPRTIDMPAGSHPFHQPYVHRYTTMMFNISTYARMLMTDFLTAGGKIEVREFDHPHELLKLPERTLINATGYGARALFNDNSIIPVRGQTARLIPQPEVTYGISSEHISMVPRSDGLLVQAFGDTGNFNNSDVTPNRAVSEAAVLQLASLVSRTRKS